MKNYRLSLALTDITKEDENIQLFEFDTMDEAEEEGYEWWAEDLQINFNTIDYLTAVDVLTRIMNEEIGLAGDDGEPFYIKKEVVVS